MKKKVALVLSGGGAKGAQQLGFIKYLFEKGLKPDVIYGTSVGSLNACGLSFHGVHGVEKVWANIKKKSDVFKFNWLSIILQSSGLYNAKPLRKIIEQNVKGFTPQIKAYSCSVNIETGEIDYCENNDPKYIDRTLASASIPTLNDDVDGYVDGGVREQSPLKKAIEDGADVIYLILCNPFKKNPDPGKKGHWLTNLIRTTDILAHEVFLNDVQNCLWYNRNPQPGKRHVDLVVYAPEKNIMDSLDFNQEKIQAGIKYGYEQAQKGSLNIEYMENL